jgi:hypothetical protein
MKPGTTLLELLLVLTMIGLLGATTMMTVRREPPQEHNSLLRAMHELDSVRSLTVRSGQERVVVISDARAAHIVTLLPDGSVITDSSFERALGLDRLTGRTRVLRRAVSH